MFYIYLAGLSMQIHLLEWISGLGLCACLSFELLVARQHILGADVAPQEHLWFVLC